MHQNTLAGVKLREIPNDIFYTPLELAEYLISTVEIQEDHSLCDPFKGKGAFFNQFPADNEKEWFEILEGRDFLLNQRCFDWMISNPPFSFTSLILELSCLYSKIGFAYILPTYQMSYVRLKKIESHGFYLNKIVYFNNPKEWKIGFQMAFFIFTRKRSESIKLKDQSDSIQKRLF